MQNKLPFIFISELQPTFEPKVLSTIKRKDSEYICILEREKFI